jgi:hypothetical protein
MLYYVAASSHRLGDALRRLERYVGVGNEALVARIQTGTVWRVGLSYTGCPSPGPAPDGVSRPGHVVTLPAGCRSNAGAACSEFRPPQVGRSAAGTKAVGCEVEFDAIRTNCFDAALMDFSGWSRPISHELMLKSCEQAMRSALPMPALSGRKWRTSLRPCCLTQRRRRKSSPSSLGSAKGRSPAVWQQKR